MIDLSCLSITQKEFLENIYIGLGINNIIDLGNCMSRMRIQISDEALLLPDEFFLSLGSKGIVRENNNIQLIFGKESPILTYQLESFYLSITYKPLIELVALCNGSDNISEIYLENNTILLTLKKIPDNFDNIIKQYKHNFINIKIHKQMLTIVFQNTMDLEVLLQMSKNIMFFWDFIQTLYLFDFLDINDIEHIDRQNFDLEISTKNIISLTNYLNNYGLDIIQNILTPKTLLIQNCSSQFIESLINYYTLKKKYLQIDNNQI